MLSRSALLSFARKGVPEPVKRLLRPLLHRLTTKQDAELRFWIEHYRSSGDRFNNDNYRTVMLAIAGEEDEAFLAGKVVADFGCGPKGTLAWLKGSVMNIGIDVLADRYAKAFPDEIRSHAMIYVTSTEQVIPLPSTSVDVMFSINALDHCSDLRAMCAEIVRVLKPDGELIASFNLNEPVTLCEPQCLTEELLQEPLLRHFAPQSCRFGANREGGTYRGMIEGTSTYRTGERGFMWFRGRRIKASQPHPV